MKALSSWMGAACAAVVGFSGVAQAHDLTCTKLVNGQASVTASTYPFTANYSFQVNNVHPTLPSILLTALDPLLAGRGFVFNPPPPVVIPVGASVTSNFALTLNTVEECRALALLDGLPDNNIDNTFTAGFDLGSSLCTARVTCSEPSQTCTNATRTLGFWRNHIPAVQQCLAGGPVPLGSIGVVVGLAGAEGILWGDPARYPITNLPRSQLDRIRFLAARQLFVATCNQRVFGGVTTPANLLELILTALGTVNCSELNTLEAQLDTYNNSCETTPFPGGFDPGPSTPEAAQALAIDPTIPTGLICIPPLP
ncbi:hypothetical protein SAMN05443572_10141 [Myxococcus fulvus]|uniref:Lipoprotein n=1 Tax=Myxococcus fulvus TaxID=33 RepID=A0A511T2U9_MYXFU|nr:hypothetical protein [Myxococcus fulvus]GEN07932.1 hypothetical protein MFU01_29690 [Myxococcus fulvus]SES74771.1 hypothetical protein SAMN05443572_10141 [Myxococcus fulvus]